MMHWAVARTLTRIAHRVVNLPSHTAHSFEDEQGVAVRGALVRKDYE